MSGETKFSIILIKILYEKKSYYLLGLLIFFQKFIKFKGFTIAVDSSVVLSPLKQNLLTVQSLSAIRCKGRKFTTRWTTTEIP
jgi:hypothetical protein